MVPEASMYRLTIKNSKGERVASVSFVVGNKKTLSNVITEDQTLCANWIAPLIFSKVSKGSCTTEKIFEFSDEASKTGVCWIVLDKELLNIDIRYLPKGKYNWKILSINNKDNTSVSNTAEFTVGDKPLPPKLILLSPTGANYNTQPVFKWTALHNQDPKKNVTHYFIWVHEVTVKTKSNGEEIVDSREIIGKRITSEEAHCAANEKVCSIQFEESMNFYYNAKGKWWVSGENSFGPGPKATTEFSSQ